MSRYSSGRVHTCYPPMRFHGHIRSATFTCLLAAPCTAFAQPSPGVALPAPVGQETRSEKSAVLDIEAMRQSVREMKFEEEPESERSRAGTALSAAPDPGTERFRKKFNSGKRADCLTAFRGFGLLALVAMPVASLIDKKDHGCKW